MKKYYFIWFFVLLSSVSSLGQVSVNFNPSLYGRSLDGLSFAQYVNTSARPVFIKVRISIREHSQGSVVTVQVPYTLLKPGLNTINSHDFSQSKVVFSANAIGNHLRQTATLSEGEYEFCFEVTIGDPKTQEIKDVSEFCFQSVIAPAAPLLLIDPAHEDKFCNTRPNFSWQPPVPIQRRIQYRIIVCEKNDKQTDVEAITYNMPVISIAGLNVNTLFFPAKTPELKKDHQYVWQVTAYQDKTILTKSEIWLFGIKCEEEKKIIVTDSYRELKETEQGNNYVADKVLRVSFNNPYNAGELKYSIAQLTRPDKQIEKLPVLKLTTGLNKYEIDLTENRDFKNGEEYVITVWLENNRILKLRFIYRNEE